MSWRKEKLKLGALEDVRRSSPWLQQETLSSVVSATVHSQHPDYENDSGDCW
ncbi:hypothetical protein AB6F62_09975 [Providencia huaxiensis]